MSDQATFFYLKNLPITPRQCYEQVRNTWDEFQPGVSAWQDEQLQQYEGAVDLDRGFLPRSNHDGWG
ncbi:MULTISPECIES: hypothetical protein [unclassified Okeania]|uniref:hypothetical protein n=1 Tax=unclassified Okeania TaxID=2634635 RepID=UPI00257F9CBE|nr:MULTISPECIES: hypothetical protein [unclassified Okeania]